MPRTLTPPKTLIIAGRRYRLAVRPWDGLVEIKGHGLVGATLPRGVGLDSTDLAEQTAAAVGRYLAAKKSAERLVETSGMAELGHRVDCSGCGKRVAESPCAACLKLVPY